MSESPSSTQKDLGQTRRTALRERFRPSTLILLAALVVSTVAAVTLGALFASQTATEGQTAHAQSVEKAGLDAELLLLQGKLDSSERSLLVAQLEKGKCFSAYQAQVEATSAVGQLLQLHIANPYLSLDFTSATAYQDFASKAGCT